MGRVVHKTSDKSPNFRRNWPGVHVAFAKIKDTSGEQLNSFKILQNLPPCWVILLDYKTDR